MEFENGQEVIFIHPRQGYVLKSTHLPNDEKVFVNVCQDEGVDCPSVTLPEDASRHENLLNTWSIPHAESPQPRKDVDRNGKACTVYDVIFHPQTLELAEKNLRFKSLLSDTALNSVEKAYNVKLARSKAKVKHPKMLCKGKPGAIVIQRPRGEQDQTSKERKEPAYEVNYGSQNRYYNQVTRI